MEDKVMTENDVMLLLARSKEEVMAEVWKDRGDIQVNSSGITELRGAVKEIKDAILAGNNFQKVQLASTIVTFGAVILAFLLG